VFFEQVGQYGGQRDEAVDPVFVAELGAQDLGEPALELSVGVERP
jgi:hypothetical protein